MRSSTQRKFVPLALLLILGLVLSACTAPAAPAPSAPDAAADTGGRALPDDAAADQTINYVTRNFNRLNPASEGGFGRPFTSHMWMPFFIRDRNHDIHPWLATGYEVSDDGLTYTVNINPDAVWSDGSPVVAQEAVDYWSWAISPDCTKCWAYLRLGQIAGAQAVIDGEADTISGLTAVDDKTLQITLEAPSPIFPASLAHYNTGFIKMEDVSGGEFAADASTRVNGPFMIEEWDVDLQKHSIVQNANWWGETQPYVQRIVAQPADDENISFIMWQNDEVDIAHWLTNIREPLRADSPEAFVLIPYATNFYFALHTTKPPMDDINVRRALVHAVDWDAAVGAAYEGARDERIMKTHLTPELPCYNADNWPDFGYDPDLAKEELAASKYGGPDDLPTIRISTGGQSPNYLRTAEIMAEQWKNVLGITDVEIRPGWADAWGQEADLINVQRNSWGATIPDPGAMISGLYQHYSTDGEVGLDDEELGAMMAELGTMDPSSADYCDKVQAAEERLLGHYYYLPMIWDLYEYVVKPHVMNFDTNVDNNWANLIDMYVVER
ncbi:MAG: ABC transporter substrate-binding protein [Chloroflexota bacterium]